MHVAVYFVCAALIFYVKGEDESNFYRIIQPFDLTADQEAVSYLLPKFTARHLPIPYSDYRNRFPGDLRSLMSRMKTEEKKDQNLSIVDSLDVLRKKLEMQINRQKQKDEIQRNRIILKEIGKRAIFDHQDFSSDHDNF